MHRETTTPDKPEGDGYKRGLPLAGGPAAESRVAPRAVSRLSPVRSRNHVYSREEYTLRSIERAFPSGEWVEQVPVVGDGPALSAAGVAADEQKPPLNESGEGLQGDGRLYPAGSTPAPSSPSLTIIGGTKYDEDEFGSYLDSLDCLTRFLVGEGRGAEQAVLKHVMDRGYGHRATVRALEPDVYGKNARKVNVEAVLSHDPTSPLLLVGSGERVKQAESWLKRANWGREVIRIG